MMTSALPASRFPVCRVARDLKPSSRVWLHSRDIRTRDLMIKSRGSLFSCSNIHISACCCMFLGHSHQTRLDGTYSDLTLGPSYGTCHLSLVAPPRISPPAPVRPPAVRDDDFNLRSKVLLTQIGSRHGGDEFRHGRRWTSTHTQSLSSPTCRGEEDACSLPQELMDVDLHIERHHLGVSQPLQRPRQDDGPRRA
jgi:hypothetical protein